MATYRNTYENFYTDKQGSYVAIGAIVPVLANQWTTDKTELGYTKPPNQSIQDPHYCQKGFLYCDGEEYDISSYPNLYEKILNTYNDSSDPSSLTNPINNNSILFTQATSPGSVYRTFVEDGNLYAELYKKVDTIGGNLFKTRVVPNGAAITFVGGLGAFPAGTDASGNAIFEEDTPVVLEYASVYQDKATAGKDTTVHRFLIGQATDTVDLSWKITSSTLIQTSGDYPILPISYYGTVPEYNPSSLQTGPLIGTGYNQFTDAENFSPQLSWGNLTGLPDGVSVEKWEVYLQNMVRGNRILWHVKDIPAAVTSFGVNQTLPSGAVVVPNTVSRASVPRPYNVGGPYDNPGDWVRDNGYSGPQPPNNQNHIYRFNVIAHLSNGTTLIESLDFTAGASGQNISIITNNGAITWSSFLTSTGAVQTGASGFDKDITSGRAVGVGGLTWTPTSGPANNVVEYNHKLEIYDPTGNGNTRSRVWPTSTTQLPWVNHGTGWTVIDERQDNIDGSRLQGTIHKIEFENYSNNAGNAGFAAIRIDGAHLMIDGEDEPLQDSPHYVDSLVSEGDSGGFTTTDWNIDWTTLAAHTNTAGTITGHPKIRIRKSFISADYPQVLGKFKVPDYRDRKLIGMGEGVNGSGSPLVENRSSPDVGAIGGKWFISKDVIDDAQEFFEVSDVSTTGYSDVTSQISSYLTGEKKFKIGPMEEYIFNRPIEHEHQLLHSVADEQYPDNSGGVDRFTTSYTNIRGRVNDFEPDTTDGTALGHSHGLIDTKPVSSAMTTYGNSVGIGDRIQEYSGGTLKDDFGNNNLPVYSDEDDELKARLNDYYPMINAFDGVTGNFYEMTTSDTKWSKLTFGTPIANVTKIVIGYDGKGDFGYNGGNTTTGTTADNSRNPLTLYNSTAITLTDLYFVTDGNPLDGPGDGYCRLYDLKLTLSGGSEIEVKQQGSGCFKYKITEPPFIAIDEITSDGSEVTVVTVDDHGLSIGDWVNIRGAGTVGEPVKYNGDHQIITDGWSTNAFKYIPENGAPANNTVAGNDTTLRKAAGYFEDVTSIPDPDVWSVDNLPTRIGGKPIYSNDPDQYGDPLWAIKTDANGNFTADSGNGNKSYAQSEDVAMYTYKMVAPGGGGASSDNDGGDGGSATAVFSLPVNGVPVTYTITLQGGRGGTKGSSTGAGGSGGTVTITSSDGNPSALLNDDRFAFAENSTGQSGTTGGQVDETTKAGGTGPYIGDYQGGSGGLGSYSTTPGSDDFYYPASGNPEYNNGSYTPSSDTRIPAGSFVSYIEVEMTGGAGGHGAKNINSNCPTGHGSNFVEGVNRIRPSSSQGSGEDGYGGDRGKGMKVFAKMGLPDSPYPSPQWAGSFSWELGSKGADGKNDFANGASDSANPAGGQGVGNGGQGGNGAMGNGSSGGGGGGSSGLKVGTSGAWIMGAGGGGGAGGGDGGWNGDYYIDACWNGGNGEPNPNSYFKHPVIAPSGFRSGMNGGQKGCTAGGGGGGGAGFGGGGTGDGGEGGDGGNGHTITGSGIGGQAGRNAFSETYVNVPSIQELEGGDGDGWIRFKVFYEGSQTNPTGGGGGAGAYVEFEIVGEEDEIRSSVAITMGSPGNAGAGAAPTAAGSGQAGQVEVTAYPVIEGGRQILGYTQPQGRVYQVPGYNTASEDWEDVSTGSTASKADIWHSSTDGVKMITPANGTFPALANHSTVPTGHPTNNYFRFYGEGDRRLRMGPLNLAAAEKLIFNVIKGTGSNGGELPDEPLELWFNSDVASDSYVKIDDIATGGAAGDGMSGAWFKKEINLDENHPARKGGVYLQLRQTRDEQVGDNANDSGDNWGIGQFGIVYGEVTQKVFVPSIDAYLPGNEGECGPDTGINMIKKTVSAKESNIRFTEGTFKLSSSTPLAVSVSARPEDNILLNTKYHRAKYLIKAF